MARRIVRSKATITRAPRNKYPRRAPSLRQLRADVLVLIAVEAHGDAQAWIDDDSDEREDALTTALDVFAHGRSEWPNSALQLLREHEARAAYVRAYLNAASEGRAA